MNYCTTGDYKTVIFKRFMEQNVDLVGLLLFPPEVLYKSNTKSNNYVNYVSMVKIKINYFK